MVGKEVEFDSSCVEGNVVGGFDWRWLMTMRRYDRWMMCSDKGECVYSLVGERSTYSRQLVLTLSLWLDRHFSEVASGMLARRKTEAIGSDGVQELEYERWWKEDGEA